MDKNRSWTKGIIGHLINDHQGSSSQVRVAQAVQGNLLEVVHHQGVPANLKKMSVNHSYIRLLIRCSRHVTPSAWTLLVCRQPKFLHARPLFCQEKSLLGQWKSQMKNGLFLERCTVKKTWAMHRPGRTQPRELCRIQSFSLSPQSHQSSGQYSIILTNQLQETSRKSLYLWYRRTRTRLLTFSV